MSYKVKTAFQRVSDYSPIKKFYQQVDNNLSEKHRKEVQTLITKMHTEGEIDDSVFLYLQDKECKTPNMYFLPKIHKGIMPPPGKPIYQQMVASLRIYPNSLTTSSTHCLHTTHCPFPELNQGCGSCSTKQLPSYI